MPSRPQASHPQASRSPSSSSGSDEEDNTVASMRKRKRKPGGKDRLNPTKKQKDEHEPFRWFSHWYIRSENTFIDYCSVLTSGIRYEAKQYGKLSCERFAEKYALELEAFFSMKDHIITFDDILPELKDDYDRLNKLGKLMNDAAGSARGNDIKGLLDKGLAYLALDLPDKELWPTIPPTSVKDQTRGHNHIILSHLLTPVRLLSDFDKDPDEYRKKILHSAIHFNDEDFPSLLYPQPSGHDPEDLEANLLQNQTAIRFFKHIFTSPSSAIRDPGTKPKKSRGQARVNRMKEVTPASIAYSYMMFWYNISAINDWRIEDDLTDRSEVYNIILGLFEERKGDDEGTIQWRMDTLKWWNFQALGIVPKQSDSDCDNQPKATTLQLLREQRAQKVAAAAARASSTLPDSSPSDMMSSDPTGKSSDPMHSTDPSSPPPPSPPPTNITVNQPVTQSPSSPTPGPSGSSSRQPLSPSRHVNAVSPPAPHPTRFTRGKASTQPSSKC